MKPWKWKCWRCVTADLGFKIVYELFCVPVLGNWRCFWRTCLRPKFYTLRYVYAVYALYVLRITCVQVLYVGCSRVCQIPALFVHKGLPIAVGSQCLAVSCQLHSSDAWSLEFIIKLGLQLVVRWTMVRSKWLDMITCHCGKWWFTHTSINIWWLVHLK